MYLKDFNLIEKVFLDCKLNGSNIVKVYNDEYDMLHVVYNYKGIIERNVSISFGFTTEDIDKINEYIKILNNDNDIKNVKYNLSLLKKEIINTDYKCNDDKDKNTITREHLLIALLIIFIINIIQLII